jgi:excisionase family DNA binding protein
VSDFEELLDIKQAARFLNVSETSLRRWTNSGRLQCSRVGQRRERRFTRAALLEFLEEQPGGAPTVEERLSHPATTRHTVDGVALPHGTHVCGLYGSGLGRAKQAADFLSDGLGPEGVCFLLAQPRAKGDSLKQLEKRRPSVRKDIAEGRLVVSQYRNSVSAQWKYWQQHLGAAVRRGARHLRVVGDVWGLASQVSPEALAEYESGYEMMIARQFPVITLCQYDVRRFSGPAILHMLKVHPDSFRYSVPCLLC